jgi:L,D-transpeptidase YbiS
MRIFAVLAVSAAAAAAIVSVAFRDRDDEKRFLADTSAIESATDEAAVKKQLRAARSSLEKLAPKKPYLVVDTHANRVFLRTGEKVMIEATCSTGSGGKYVDRTTGRQWIFDTPRGVFTINSKTRQPWWRKPDWAFLEEGEPIPENEKERYDPEMMGEFALGFGDGYFIHGTIYERLLGISVTHGCVRVGSEDLRRIFDAVPVGTALYIF